jgi:hypothetical protein
MAQENRRQEQGRRGSAGEVERVRVEDARREVESGRALLVCAYDDARCARVRLQGAITARELGQREASLPRDQELIFYCA